MHLECSGIRTDFQNIFWASRPTDDLFRVLVHKIATMFNVSSATRAVGLDTSAEAYLEPC